MGYHLSMKVLGRELIAPFDEFWEFFANEIPVDKASISSGNSAAFGDQGADLTAPHPPSWMSLPDSDLAYHVAHELTHKVMTERNYPKAARGIGYAEDSAEARVGGDLEEMVLHPALEKLIEPFGFDNSFILERMASGAFNGLRTAPLTEWGTPWFFTWAIRFCELQIELPIHWWTPIEAIYKERVSAVCDLGTEFFEIMQNVGWGTREQSLEALIRCRDILGMRVDDRILILDPATGNTF
jgi:hypothetical protein